MDFVFCYKINHSDENFYIDFLTAKIWTLTCFILIMQLKNHLTNHMSTHDEERRADRMCDECGSVFKWSQRSTAQIKLRDHQKTCKGAGERPHLCEGDDCNETFSSKRKLQAHQSHCQLMVYKCERCQQTFRTKRLLGLHKNKSCPYGNATTYLLPANSLSLMPYSISKV